MRDGPQEGLEEAVARQRVGISHDYWVEVYNVMQEWERVMLVFGYANDRLACDEIIHALRQSFSAAIYRCVPAN